MPKPDQTPDAVLAAVLRELRERRGMTREALAYRASITAGSLARIELGQANPAWPTVRCILAALDVTLADLAAEIEAQETGTDRSRSRSR